MDGGTETRRGNDQDASQQAVSLSFFRFGPLHRRLWAFTQMGFARRPLKQIAGADFVKLLGAGTGEGFTPIPDTSVMAVLVVWPDLEAARDAVSSAPVYRRLRGRAAENFTLYLEPVSARGEWAGSLPFRASDAVSEGPVAALTRASIRPWAALKFWRLVPAISERIGSNDDVIFKAGIGEVPWLHQVTFSIWPDTDAMAAFARADGPHAAAIRAVASGIGMVTVSAMAWAGLSKGSGRSSGNDRPEGRITRCDRVWSSRTRDGPAPRPRSCAGRGRPCP